MDYFLGKRPTGATNDSKVDLGMIVRDIDELMVLNDEAHHIHDAGMAWFKSISPCFGQLLSCDNAIFIFRNLNDLTFFNNNLAPFILQG